MPTIGSQDNVTPCRGEFTMRVVDKCGNTVSEYSDRNMIVNLSKVAMALLVSELSPEAQGKVITTFGVGTGEAQAAPDDTSLTNAYTNAVLSHDFPSPGRVRFTWSLDYGEANGRDISEFGLFCADGSMFAHKVRGAVHKDSDLAFEGTWTIIF